MIKLAIFRVWPFSVFSGKEHGNVMKYIKKVVTGTVKKACKKGQPQDTTVKNNKDAAKSAVQGASKEANNVTNKVMDKITNKMKQAVKIKSLLRLLLLIAVGNLVPAMALAFNGPFTSLVTVETGVELDVDVRWPDTGVAPANGWPVVFFAHGAGGDKTTWAGLAGQYADDGYVTLTYTNRPDDDRSPTNFANDIVALKAWLLNDFQTEAIVIVPTDTNAYGIAI